MFQFVAWIRIFPFKLQLSKAIIVQAKICLLPGDGIGPEIVQQAQRVLESVAQQFDHQFEFETRLMGGCAIDDCGDPLPEVTLETCRQSDAILLGAVGGPKWDDPRAKTRPEQGLLKIRKELGLFANLRPVCPHPSMISASPLKPEIISGVDILFVRELTGGIYFGQRGRRTEDGIETAYDEMAYSVPEVERIVRLAGEAAMGRGKRVTSVDKANVLEVSELWREVVTEVGKSYPEVELSHMYIDNACMQLVRAPKQFDVIVTTNMFGDILSDAASMLTGSIGMLPSASLDSNGKGMYEPVHGSAPDIAGEGKANPLATILSVAMMMRSTFGNEQCAAAIEAAVKQTLADGIRTGDIAASGEAVVSTAEMGSAVVERM